MSELPQKACILSISKGSSSLKPPLKVKNLVEASNQQYKPKEIIYVERSSSLTEEQNRLFNEETIQDTEFQFSDQIMRHNPHNLSREKKQSTTIPWLNILVWMAEKASNLKLSKEVLYVGFLTLKRFLGSQKRTALNTQNRRKFALVCLLLSSKVNCIGGNFLISQADKTKSQQNLVRRQLFSYQQLVLNSLRFKVPTSSFITEVMVKILLAWNNIVKDYNLKSLSFQFEPKAENGRSSQGYRLFQMYVYLIDYIMVRKIAQMPTKELNLLESKHYFEQTLTNILLHLGNRILKHYCMLHLQENFKQAYAILVKEINSCPKQQNSYYRESSLLQKRIRKLFEGHNQLFRQTQKVYKITDKRQKISTPQHFQKQCIQQFEQKMKPGNQTGESPKQSNQSLTLSDNEVSNKLKIFQNSTFQKQVQEFRIRLCIDMEKYVPLIEEKNQRQPAQSKMARPQK